MAAGGRRARAGADRDESDEELVALIRSRPGEDPEREAACAALVARYEGMVRACAARYQGTPESAEELLQVGYLGLMKAINGFDPAFGGSLGAYAAPCVIGEIKRHFRDKRWQIRVGRPAQELRLRIRAATAELTQELARAPRDSELAERLDVSEAEITEAQLASQAFQVSSLDAPAGGDDYDAATIGDLIGAEDPGLEHVIDIDAVWAHCAELPPREQRLLMLRFYGNMTQDQIAGELGISQMHVSRLLTGALSYLRGRVTGQGKAARDQGRPVAPERDNQA
jgi:RNA polymerase sigma-B factor